MSPVFLTKIFSVFRPDISNIQLDIVTEDNQAKVFDPIRRRRFVLTPEEHVRQYILQFMLQQCLYPAALIAVEKSIKLDTRKKRFDIVVYNRQHVPWMLVECKAPQITITEQTLHQLLAYQKVVQSSFWVLTNGVELYCADARDKMNIEWQPSLPSYGI
jgi:hypothetical protein